jgi:L-ornithine Nalpha-acyltransferase
MQTGVSAQLRRVFETMRPLFPPSNTPKSDIVRETYGLPLILGRVGSLEVRLATTRKDIRKAQKLRYKVFFEEMSAVPPAHLRLLKRDKDVFDRVCDHLLVIDRDHVSGPLKRKKPRVVGTYRLLRQDTAGDMAGDTAGNPLGFYTASEFDIDTLIERHPDQRFLELGRSCVLAPYRNKKTVELLWQGIWAYVQHHKIDVMFGCASLEGTNPDRLKQELSFLHHYAKPAEGWNARAVPSRYAEMNRMSKEAIDPKRALVSLPPLVKGYLRLGCKIGEGAVIDHQFGTTDVLIILRVVDIDQRYITYYAPDAAIPAV